MPAKVLAELRTDHAGETGAVWIYRGLLAAARDPGLRSFAERHLATEQAHLRAIEFWLPTAHHSRLLPIWRVAGCLTGALPALLGQRATYTTIEVVERFVDHHYEHQIRDLQAHPELCLLRDCLLTCQADEIAHLDEAATARGSRKPGVALRAWCWLVDAGSRSAVLVSRHI